MHPIDHIKSFARITPAIESRLLDIMTEQQMQRGDTVSGTAASNYACFIVAGAARVFYTQRGVEHTVNFVFDNQYLVVQQTLLEKHGDTLTIEFLEPSTVIFAPHSQVRDELELSQAVTGTEPVLLVNSALIHYTRHLEEFLTVALTCNARDRYLWAIKKFPRLTKCATLTQIASFLGMTKETLYRLRASLDKETPHSGK